MHNNPLTRDKVGTLKDVTLTALGDGEILVSSSGIWVNQTLAEAGVAAASHTHSASSITDFTEAVQDVVGALFSDTSTIDITYNDAAGTLVADILASNVLASLNVFTGDSGSGGAKGLVPAPATGDATKYLRGDGTWTTVSGGSGTVTSVAVSVPSGFGVSGSPVTTSGTIAISADSQSAGKFYASPSGSSGTPSFRVIVAADLPVMVGDSGSGGTKGAVPASASGDYAAGKYLDAGGNWSVPAGGGSGSSHWHDPVEVATTGNVNLAGGGLANGTTHDTVAVQTGWRIWVANQTDPIENGLYIVPASGAASRSADMPAGFNASGSAAKVKRGSLYVDREGYVTSNTSVVGTDPITVALLEMGATTVAANLVKSGPASGSAALPDYRTLVPADLPAAVQGWQANHLINTSFRTWGHAVTSPVTLTDGAYVGPTGWFFLSSGTTCTVGTGTGLGNSASSIVLTNNSGSNRRMGASQFVEYYDCLGLRGKEVTFTIKVKRSASGNVRAALVNWTGTANSPTKDIVNDWTSSTYTEGNFFVSSANLDIIAVSSAVSVGTSATAVSVTGTVGASTNNLQVIVWSEDNIADAGTIEFSEAVLSRGATAVSYEIQPYDFEMFRCDYRCRLHSSDSSQTDAILGWGHGASTTVAVCQVPLGHGMRVVPTLSYTAADWQVADSVGARQDVTALAISSTVSSRRILFMTSTVASGLTVGRGMATVADTTAGRYLVLDAEIGV